MESLSHGEFDKTLDELTKVRKFGLLFILKAMENGEIPDFKDLNLDNFGNKA
jgi:hypothetical protein